MPTHSPKPPFHLVAGHVALDFVNTLDDLYEPGGPKELLESYDDVLRFAEQSGICSGTEAAAWRKNLPRMEAGSKLAEARSLRNCLGRIFADLVEGVPLGEEQLQCLNLFLPDVLRHRRLGIDQHQQPGWTWNEDAAKEPTAPLWSITLAAAELLASETRELVKACGNETCRWLFLDVSKNHTRRWCDMKLCGNRAKAREFYRRSAEGPARNH